MIKASAWTLGILSMACVHALAADAPATFTTSTDTPKIPGQNPNGMHVYLRGAAALRTDLPK